jgi:hypothetical protein
MQAPDLAPARKTKTDCPVFRPSPINILPKAPFADDIGAVHTPKAKLSRQVSLVSLRGLPAEPPRLHESRGREERLRSESASRWTAFYGEREEAVRPRNAGDAADHSPKPKRVGGRRRQSAES